MRDRARDTASSEAVRSQQSVNLRRRGFLLSVGAGAVGAAAAPAARAQAAVAPATEEAAAGGYRETERVRTYYRTARI